MPARSTLHWLPLTVLLGLTACSLDPQPEPPLTPSGAAGSAGGWIPGADAAAGGSALLDGGLVDATSEASACPGCGENKCDGDAACETDCDEAGCCQQEGGCPDADADACSPDATDPDAGTDDAAIDASLD